MSKDRMKVSMMEFARAMASRCILKEDESTRAMSVIEFLVFTGEQYGLLEADRKDDHPGGQPVCDLAREAMEDAVENPGKFVDPSMLRVWHGIEGDGSETYYLWAREGIVASGHRA